MVNPSPKIYAKKGRTCKKKIGNGSDRRLQSYVAFDGDQRPCLRCLNWRERRETESPKFKRCNELGFDIYYRVHELSPEILILRKLDLDYCSLLALPRSHLVEVDKKVSKNYVFYLLLYSNIYKIIKILKLLLHFFFINCTLIHIPSLNYYFFVNIYFFFLIRK